jgi:hypothetical protein
MSLRRCWIIPLIVGFIASDGQAGIFKRNPKPDPAVHVPALIKTLKTDPEDRKRANAVEELRDYDLKAFPEILPAWIEALQNDNSTSVRLEAVASIGKMRPISQQGGYALEQAAHNDSAIRVRVAADRHLLVWQLIGYQRGKPPENKTRQTGEPPLADPLPMPKGLSSVNPSTTRTAKDGEPYPSPPLMPSPPSTTTKPILSRPLFPLIPTRNPKPSKPSEDGPALNPPM